MAIPKFLQDLAIISKLGDNPGSDNNLTTSGFRAKFDAAGLAIQEFINNILIPEIEIIKSPVVISATQPSQTGILWFDTSCGADAAGMALLSLDEDESGEAVTVEVEGETYGVENASVNAGASSGGYDFTVL